MGDNYAKNNNKNKGENGISVSPVEVHMFDFGLQGFLDKLMTSNLICGAGTFVSFLLAFIFGVMFLIGGIGLVKSKNSGGGVAKTAPVETNGEEGAEISGNEAEGKIEIGEEE